MEFPACLDAVVGDFEFSGGGLFRSCLCSCVSFSAAAILHVYFAFDKKKNSKIMHCAWDPPTM